MTADEHDVGIGKGSEAAPRKRRSFHSHEQLIGLVLLSAAFIVGSLSVASGLRSRNQSPQTHQITITGSAEQAVTSDTFTWTANVASTQPTTSAALAQLNGWTAEINSVLVGAGAKSDEIAFGTASVHPNAQANGPVSSFTLSESVTVQSHRLNAMQRVLGVSSFLLASNVPFIAQQPQYTFSGLKKLRPVLTAEASANARQRARAALAKQAQLGKPITISVGQVSVDAPGSVSYGSGDFNTSSIRKIVSVVVYATYST